MISRRHALLTSSGFIIGGLTPFLTGCGRHSAPVRALGPQASILCLGDSLTFGYGATNGGSYPEQLGGLLARAVVNAGVNGDVSESAAYRLPALLVQHAPGLVLVGVGGNDFLRQYPLNKTETALERIVSTISPKAQVVLIAEPKPSLVSAAVGSLSDHPIYEKVAKRLNVPLFSDGWSDILSKEALRSDNIHANDAGYALFAERLAKWLKAEGFFG